ncbi:hypothetical protein LMB49_10665 [Limosilactobacillus reuteri]|nr:hypothetical protein [Limosilactobacillus reuteri]MCC4371854.1 hypothetical protein [Limosilactobacillus reuteri]
MRIGNDIRKEARMIMSPEQFYLKYCSSDRVVLIAKRNRHFILDSKRLWEGFYIYCRHNSINGQDHYYYDAYKDKLDKKLCLFEVKKKFFGGNYELLSPLKEEESYNEQLAEDLSALVSYMNSIFKLRDKVIRHLNSDIHLVSQERTKFSRSQSVPAIDMAQMANKRIDGWEGILYEMDCGPKISTSRHAEGYFVNRYTDVMMGYTGFHEEKE